ncbi:MAG: UDP-2,4-diacetamido-2,4,6-trideoxy-beta-L-altropyranose hydrolase, partial [Alicyclobacillus sp.]|nr:UDP-2,4-diacetamido-2,4,6-trideoxy-beta-L-altropyranose hydrolase [Alicyclobacillus sp.]
SVDWLIVDHPSLDERWEGALCGYVDRILVIDDLANRPHDCDLLVDHNLHDNIEHRYDPWLDSRTIQLLGPGYALLRPEFARIRSRMSTRIHRLNRVIVSFGGVDAGNETAKVLRALASWHPPGVQVDVIAGQANPNWHMLQRTTADLSHVTLHRQVDDMAAMMAKADLAIGACGLTALERCCLGLPALVAVTSAAQRAPALALAATGSIVHLGDAVKLTYLQYLQAIYNVDTPLLRSMSKAAMQLVDGLGCSRVADALMDFPSLQAYIEGVSIADDIRPGRETHETVQEDEFSEREGALSDADAVEPVAEPAPDPIRRRTESRWGVLVIGTNVQVPVLNMIRAAMDMVVPGGVLHVADTDVLSPVQHFADTFWTAPNLSQQPPEDVLQFCVDHEIRALIPVTDRDVLYLAEHAAAFEQQGIACMVASLDAVCVALDHWLFTKTLRDAGLPAVQTELDLPKMASDRVVVKERYGGQLRGIPLNLSHVEAAKYAETLQHPVFQPFVAGQPYWVDLYITPEGIAAGAATCRLEVQSAGGGWVASTLQHPELESLAVRIALQIRLTGHVTIKALLDPEAGVHILGCVPRLHDYATLSWAAGLRSVEWYLRRALTRSEAVPVYEQSPQSIRMIRHWVDRVDVLNP